MKTAFLILGAQRSGTSVISHSLSKFGVDFGDRKRFIQGGHNPIFFELAWVNDINNQIVSCLGHQYIDFFLPIEADFGSKDLVAIEQQLQAQLNQEWPHSHTIGLKDPRLSLTFSVWQRVLAEMEYTLQVILAFRSPAGFLASNKKLFHNWAGWDEARHLNFWLQFNLAAIYFTRHYPTYWLNYDNLMAQPQTELTALSHFFGLDAAAIAAAISVINPAQYHHAALESTGFPLIDHYYDRLRSHDLTPEDYLHYREQFTSPSLISLQLT
jgi:hypothetical protein